ncbi:MAG: hypothetical protein WCT03_23600 [Candidatus Obscuribacterales bacterium]|jgi:hypothetical protein
MLETDPRSARNPNEYPPVRQNGDGDGQVRGGQSKLEKDQPHSREANDLLKGWGFFFNTENQKKQNFELEGAKVIPPLCLGQSDRSEHKKEEAVEEARDSKPQSQENNIQRVTAMGEGIHDGGNGITITKVGGAEIIGKGNDQIAVGEDGEIYASAGAKITKVKVRDKNSNAGAREGTEVEFKNGLRAVIYNGHIVQYGIGPMTRPSQYEVVYDKKKP